MKLNWDELLSVSTPPFLIVTSRTRDIDLFIRNKPSNKNIIIRKIQGKNFSTQDEIFKEFSGALQFPYYFGNNWNAFDECMSDLSWLGNNEGYLLFITNSEYIKSRNIEDFIEVMNEIVKFWTNKNIFIKVIFQTEKEVNPKIKSISASRELEPIDDTL